MPSEQFAASECKVCVQHNCVCNVVILIEPYFWNLCTVSLEFCLVKSLAELSQDVASKGLGLIYELGSEQDQQELVTTLVDTLMTGKRYSEFRTQWESTLELFV